MSTKHNWDAELYEARHSFVWELARGIVELLAAQAGERILDVGCGPGQLTNLIAESGASVVGIDSSPDMVGQARQNFPSLTFRLEDVCRMTFNSEFDAVFSNATLHWVRDATSATKAMARALKPAGRFVAEFGGFGNIQTIQSAIRSTLERYLPQLPESRLYFPSIGEYTSVLESQGLEVTFATLFDRPTPLEGENGMSNWIRQFQWFDFELLPADQRSVAVAETVDVLRPALFRDGVWFADYRRLRVVAAKPK